MTIDNIAVIGAGTMGSGIVQVLLQSGLNVLLHDADQTALTKASATVAERLRQQTAKGRLDPDTCDKALAALRTTGDFAALTAADMVVEVVPERLDLKVEIFSSFLIDNEFTYSRRIIDIPSPFWRSALVNKKLLQRSRTGEVVHSKLGSTAS